MNVRHPDLHENKESNLFFHIIDTGFSCISLVWWKRF